MEDDFNPAEYEPFISELTQKVLGVIAEKKLVIDLPIVVEDHLADMVYGGELSSEKGVDEAAREYLSKFLGYA